MKMRSCDYRIYAVDGGNLFVVGNMLSYSMDWPETLKDPNTGREFKFTANEVMEPWMVGNHHGHARYVAVE